jgi:hypothetical protein
MGLGRVETFGSAEFRGAFEGAAIFGAGYALIAAISGRTPMMLITLVIL